MPDDIAAHHDDDATEAKPVVQWRSSRLYFPTGDIVLCAASTCSIPGFKDERREEHYFRVDTVFLSRHSPVFADMLTFPPVADGVEMYDGAPLVRLVGDDASAVRDMLDFMYNPASVLLLPSRGNL